MALHDAGDFDGAIAKYKQVLAMNPEDTWALHEMSYTYFTKKDYVNALALARQGAEFQSRSLGEFYAMIGNCLDEMGKRKDALDVYKAAIKRVPDEFLLYFNYGVALSREGNKQDAKKALENAVACNPNHASSHKLLGDLYAEMQFRIPAIMAYSRFLALEPSTPRAQQVLPALQSLITGNVTKGEKEGDVNIMMPLNLGASKEEGDFSSAELMLSINIAANVMGAGKDDAKKEPASPFAILTGAYSSLAESLSIGKLGKGFAATYYAPYFAALGQAELTESFVCHAWRAGNVNGAAEWENENGAKRTAFETWTKEYQWAKR